MLVELPLPARQIPIPEAIQDFAREGLRRSRAIDCFDFVPSSYAAVYAVLQQLPRGIWCEWGSGIGINTGIAASLGYAATGIEVDARLAAASRELLADFELSATIVAGDYFQIVPQADLYFVYCWPGQMARVEQHFHARAPDSAKLLICHGAEDVRCKIKS